MSAAGPDPGAHWIIGTAGHIDHGKTSLVKALTGQDTDRLKEEKERGMSIELGFAWLDLPDGTRAGVVDVPGHERFVRTMLAGAHGVDLVLFVVAADDGVMPQTVEHLDILHLLGVGRAVFVITKADLVTPARVEEVSHEVGALAAATTLRASPIQPCSLVTGEGLDALRRRIEESLHGLTKAPARGYFRLPVDRAFASQGHGLVVTGTAVAGEVKPGDKVRCLPAGTTFRVRNVHVHGAAVDRAVRGQRVALNLAGPDDTAVVRGDVVCHERIVLTSERFDARVEARSAQGESLKDHQRVRLYLGTTERLATLVPLASPGQPRVEEVVPGRSTYCQMVLLEPMLALRGDRFVLRDETARRTIGGGVVIRPAARRHKRGGARLLERLETLDRRDTPAVVEALIEDEGSFALALPRLADLAGSRDEELGAELARSERLRAFSVDGETYYAAEARCSQLQQALVSRLAQFHASRPLLPGMDIEEARAGCSIEVPPRLFRALVDDLAKAGALRRDGSVLSAPGHAVALDAGEQALAERIRRRLADAPLAPPDTRQLAAELSLEPRRLTEMLGVMLRQGSIVRVAADLYFTSETIARVRRDLVDQLSQAGTLTASDFRTRHQTTRKYAIPLLEFFDREGTTVRVGEVRRLRQRSAAGTT